MKSNFRKGDFNKESSANQLVDFLNSQLEKDKKTATITADNIQESQVKETDPNGKIVREIDVLIESLQKQSNQGTKKYNVPTIIVITGDTYNVVDLNKVLVQAYKALPSDCQYDVHVQKLFAKHIKPEEQ
jgi:hypothetical protein